MENQLFTQQYNQLTQPTGLGYFYHLPVIAEPDVDAKAAILLRLSTVVNNLYKLAPDIQTLAAEVDEFINQALQDPQLLKAYLTINPQQGKAKQVSKLSKIILPSTRYKPEKVLRAKEESLDGVIAYHEKDAALKLRRFIQPTGEQSSLDVLQIKFSTQTQTKPSEYTHVVWFSSNATTVLHNIEELTLLAKELAEQYQQPISLTTFNYRGVLHSSGNLSAMQDLIDDGVKLVFDLCEQGALAEKMTLVGQSLGGAIATGVAAHCHQKNIAPVSLMNIRSFNKISHVKPGLRFLGDNVLKKWNLDIAALFKTIPQENRMLLSAAKMQNGDRDRMIRSKASLATGMGSNFFNASHRLRVNTENRSGSKPVDLHMLSLDSLKNLDGTPAIKLLGDFVFKQNQSENLAGFTSSL